MSWLHQEPYRETVKMRQYFIFVTIIVILSIFSLLFSLTEAKTHHNPSHSNGKADKANNNLATNAVIPRIKKLNGVKGFFRNRLIKRLVREAKVSFSSELESLTLQVVSSSLLKLNTNNSCLSCLS